MVRQETKQYEGEPLHRHISLNESGDVRLFESASTSIIIDTLAAQKPTLPSPHSPTALTLLRGCLVMMVRSFNFACLQAARSC
jgi:hypothetical protein